MANPDGKKIDEIMIDFSTRLVLRYHSGGRSFTVEAGDESFSGKNLDLLIEQGTVHLFGWSKLKWEPVICVVTEIYDDMQPSFQRLFKSKHKGKVVYRSWRVGEVNEPPIGAYSSGRKKEDTTGSMTGEPGEVHRNAPRGRVMAFTPERWNNLKALRDFMEKAMDAARGKFGKILEDSSEADLDLFLTKTTADRMLPFSGKAQ